jgi:hypothetical protein
MTNDPARNLESSGGVFLEINTTPGIHHHYLTDRDQRERPVADAVLEALLREASTAARPIQSAETSAGAAADTLEARRFAGARARAFSSSSQVKSRA